jgi:TRAP-type C4-dicarboxylate transport system permease small subunit
MTDGSKPSKSKQIEELVFIKMPHVAGGILFLVAAALNIINVIARYVFSNPIFWAEEILIFIIIWGVFLVAGSITYRGGHLNMDLIYSTMSPRWKRAVNIAIALTLIVCTVYTAMQSWKVVMLHYQSASQPAPIFRWCSHLALLFWLHLRARGNGAHPLLYLRQVRVRAAMYWVMAILPFVLLLLGFPIFLLLLATSLVILLFLRSADGGGASDIFNSLNKYALLRCRSSIRRSTGVARQSRTGLRRDRHGGFRAHIPMTSLGFAALFGAISGVTTAATAAIGTLTYPRMREAGYSERFASALITAEGALDNLIPPSIAMIIYGIASDTSVIQLFAAGIGPGLLLAGMFGVYIYYHSWRVGIMESEHFYYKEFLLATRDCGCLISATNIIFGGIYSGVFSPTEAAGVACIYAIIVSYLRLSRNDVA